MTCLYFGLKYLRHALKHACQLPLSKTAIGVAYLHPGDMEAIQQQLEADDPYVALPTSQGPALPFTILYAGIIFTFLAAVGVPPSSPFIVIRRR